MLHWFRGAYVVRICGAEPMQCLNRFAAAGIAFWNLRQPGEMELRCRIYRKDRTAAERAALRALCTLEPLRERGLPSLLDRLRRRPVLALGLPLVLALALMLQSFVWFVRIDSDGSVPEAALRHALWEEGIGFGAWGPSVSGPFLRMRMQLRLPGLQWLAANRSGGVLTVIARGRSPVQKVERQSGPANVAAARAGIITSVSALRGTPAVAVGDAVRTGDLLISGITTWESCSQLTRASGEVYALTSRQIRAVIPEICLEKRYTGEMAQCLDIIFGRNRRKIFGNSRISQGTYDKIVTQAVCSLPGGYALPLTLERTQLRFYETVAVPLREDTARALLEAWALRSVQAQMIAGRVLQTSFELTKEKGCYVLTGELSCEEMISQTVPIRLLGEDEAIGEAD